MPEAWMLELISAVRDVARANAMYRLAEHLDDAMLIAASEFHTTDAQARTAGQDEPEGSKALRDAAQHRLH